MTFKQTKTTAEVPQYRLSDFANWNMYKNYLSAWGILSLNLGFERSDFKAYLAASKKTSDVQNNS